VPTKDEAYAIALEHNKAYDVPAVYVHGEAMKKGRWEQPPAASHASKETHESQASQLVATPFEQTIMQVGDQAMQDVMKDLASSQQPSRKPMNKNIAYAAVWLSLGALAIYLERKFLWALVCGFLPFWIIGIICSLIAWLLRRHYAAQFKAEGWTPPEEK
jgi:Flp pilus assembly protein TadB